MLSTFTLLKEKAVTPDEFDDWYWEVDSKEFLSAKFKITYESEVYDAEFVADWEWGEDGDEYQVNYFVFDSEKGQVWVSVWSIDKVEIALD